MSFFTRFSLKNVSAILILCVLIVFGGVYSASTLKKEMMPNINIPIVGVITIYPGASPGDIQEKITKPVESLVSSVSGIKKVNSTSSENFSSVIAQFDYDANMDEMQRKVEAAIKSVKLPENVAAPNIIRINFNEMPVLYLSVSNSQMKPDELEQKVKETVIPMISGIEGVGQVNLASETEKAVFIKLLPEKLKEYNMTSQTVSQMLQANNISFPAGSVTLNDTVEPIRITGKFNTLDELKNLQLPVIPNTQAMMSSTFSQMGQGVAALGEAVGQIGQGMAGMSQAYNGELKLIAAISETQTKLIATKFALSEANQTLNNEKATKEEKQVASAAIQQLTPAVQMTEAALDQMQKQLKSIQAQMAKQSAAQPAMVTATPGVSLDISQGQPVTSSALPSGISLQTVKLSDIAEITVGTDKASTFSRTDGNPSIVLQIAKTQSANTVDVSDAVKAKLDNIKGKIPGTEVTTILDQADYVKESVNGILREGLVGALFAFLVILLFLRNFRTTIIACVSIPLSVLITLIFLKQLNITLNILTLGGMSVAIGRIVDDSIVVIENIYRQLQTNMLKTVELIKLGAKEVSSAITSSTLTTVAVFLPVSLVSGMAGVMFKPFALTVALSLLSSLLVAVTIIPVLSKLLLLKAKSVKHSEFHEGKIMKKYESLLSWSLNHKLLALGISLFLLIGSLCLTPFIGTSFVAEEKENYVDITMNYPAGTDVNVVNEQAQKIEKMLSKDRDVLSYQTTVGTSSTNMMAAMMAKGSGDIMVHLKKDADVDAMIARYKKNIIANKPNVVFQISQSSPGNSGMESMNNLEVKVTGTDLAKIKETAELLTKEFKTIKGLDQVTNNLTISKPEIAIRVNQQKASALALSAAQVGMTMRELLNDNTVTTLLVDKSSMNVRLGLKLDEINGINQIKDIALSSPMGGTVKVSDIAEVEEVPGPVSIVTADGQEYAQVTGKITVKDTGSVTASVQKKINAMKLPEGVKITMGGVSEMMGDTFTQLGIAMVVAVFAVFFVMVIALGEAIAPLAILFSLPLAAIGGLIALFITRIPLDMPSMIGALMLIGIVVTNAIVLIDRVQQKRKEGLSIREALLEAGKIRMRPILMTAIATIAALMPLAFGFSKGSVMSQSLAVIVIGGLTTSTFLTLVIVPVAYEMLQNLKFKILGKREEVCN